MEDTINLTIPRDRAGYFREVINRGLDHVPNANQQDRTWLNQNVVNKLDTDERGVGSGGAQSRRT